MTQPRDSRFVRSAMIAAVLLFAASVVAQDDDVLAEEEESEELEEIVVRAYRPGGKTEMDARYEELFRSKAAIELSRLNDLDEEYEWRKSMSENASESRIKWGYDAEAEQAIHRDTSSTDLSFETETGKPATVFRIQF